MITPLADGRFLVSVYLPPNSTGKKRLKRICEDEPTAKAVYKKVKAGIALGKLDEVLAEIDGRRGDELTLSGLLDRYEKEYVEFYNRSKDTKKSRIRLLKKGLGTLPVTVLAPAHVSAHAARRRREDEVTNATLNREIDVVRHALAWALRQGLVEKNPLANLQDFPEERQLPPESEVLEAAIAAVFGKLEDEVRPLFAFMYETGCRREEALSLCHPQLRLEEGVAILPRTKSGKPRYLGLTEAAIAAVQAMPRVSEYVFYNPDTLERWWDCRGPWERAREAAEQKTLKMKDLRTAFAMRLADTPGIEKHVIQELLGHTSLSTTDRFYAFHSAKQAVKRGLTLVKSAVESRKKGAVA